MGRDGLHGGTPPLSFSHLLPPTGELGWEIPAPVNQLHTVVAQGIEVTALVRDSFLTSATRRG